MTERRAQRGNVFSIIFATVALTGVLAAVSMQTLTGPVTTITRVTQRNVAETQMLMNARIIINAAIAGTAGGDADADGFIEPAAFVAAGGGETPPTGGGYLPTSLGLSLTDPWGSKYGYCVWDHGTTNTSAGHITGDNTVTAPQQPVIAVIAAGPDKTFQTTCPTYGGSVLTLARGGDDLIQKFTYAEASTNSNGLWTLKTGDTAKAELKDSGGTARVTIDRATGIGDFLGITTDTIAARDALLTLSGGLKLDTETNVTACTGAEAGSMRYNAAAGKLEFCNGTAWKPAGGAPDATFITQTPSADLSAEQALSGLSTGIMKVTTGTGVITSGAVDLSGAEATGILAAERFPALTGEVTTTAGSLATTVADDILDFTEFKDAMTLDASTDISATGTNVLSITNTGTGNSLLINDEAADATPFVIDAAGNVGIGKEIPGALLDVAGNAAIGGTLGVTGAATLSSTLAVTGNATFDTDTLFVDATGNEVGIGTTDPGAKLEVVGAIKLGSQAACDAGGANNGTVRYDSATKKFQLCVDGVWGSISSIAKLDDIGDVDASAPTDGQVVAWDNASSTWKPKSLVDLGPGNFDPAGADKQVQFNDSGAFGVDADFTWTKGTNYLDLGGASTVAASVLRLKHVAGAPPVSGGALPGGANGQVQFNDNGIFGTDADFVWTKASNLLDLGSSGTVSAAFIRLKMVAGNPPVSGYNVAGGTNGYVQFNSGGLLNGSPDLVWDNATKNLGVGVAAPLDALHVAGSLRTGGVTPFWRTYNSSAAPGSRSWQIQNSGSLYFGTAADDFSAWQNASVFVLARDGNASLAGTLTQNSDARLKTDIANIQDALNHLSKLRGVTYRWKDRTKDQAKQMGVLAQEVQDVFPELVRTDREGLLSVNYAGFVAPFIESVKQLKTENDSLKARMELIDARVQALEAK